MFVFQLVCLSVLAVGLIFVSHRFCKSELLDELEHGDLGDSVSFQRNWLLVFGLAQLAHWMQAPYLFHLYASYGYKHSEIVTFFLITYASSALFGTAVGSAADRYGRKRGCQVFLVLFVLSTLAKYDASDSFGRVWLAHTIDGVSLSLLYTSFESWMVSENYVLGFPQSHLHRTFELGSILNGALAVVAGILASLSGSFTGSQFGPFWVSFVPIGMAGLLMRFWSENYGEVAGPFRVCVPFALFARDQKIVLLGLAQTFFDSAMYVVRYAWMPAMAMGSEHPDSYGIVFGCLMLSVMIGGILFSMARKSILCGSSASSGGDSFGSGSGGTSSFARISLPAHAVAFVCLLGTVMMFDAGSVTPLFWCFVGVEASYGYFWPCYGVMRSEFLPETHRSTVMNLFLVPRNLVVALALIYNSYLSTLSAVDPSSADVSAGAAVKMLEHSLRGVEKGMSSANRMPVEVSTTTSFLLRCDCHSFSLPTSWLTSLLCSFFFSSFFLYFFSFIFLLCSSTFFSPSSPHPLPPLLLHRSWACSLVVLPLIPTIHTPSL